ncbi:hypothetical protein G7046_g2723 [Stylonectria norvegica]|nr:hypothetical protein G7046_g2723 [Stylonectria norvegica]
MKPLLPFPFPIHIGTDICQISRIYTVLSSPRANRFVARILRPEERAVNQSRLQILKRGVETYKVPRDPELWSCASFIAGRFAAKEAAIKAHWKLGLTFHDISIERQAVEGPRLGSGPPVVRILGGEGDAADRSALVSISHDGHGIVMPFSAEANEIQGGKVDAMVIPGSESEILEALLELNAEQRDPLATSFIHVAKLHRRSPWLKLTFAAYLPPRNPPFQPGLP